MAAQVLQTNLNHASQAQDNFIHTMAERDCELGIVAEPYRIPPGHPCWAADTCDSVAFIWRQTRNCAPFQKTAQGSGFVAIKWGRIFMIAVYLPPRLNRAEFDDCLDRIADCIRSYAPGPIIVAGDFNAHSTLWGSPKSDRRGLILEVWAAQLGLSIVNTGSTSTYTSQQGESIIDLTWASPNAAPLIREWKVATEIETLSDHRCLSMKISAIRPDVLLRRKVRDKRPLRWILSRLDINKLLAAINAEL